MRDVADPDHYERSDASRLGQCGGHATHGPANFRELPFVAQRKSHCLIEG
ncbi:hypothetical protein MPS_0983 [Mycobacterium pseudoshottsii JCM 15466]|nr:hypothetical protein MPS_0983 [Mycobacterium pseudoshottsii JCM 15466]